MQLPQHGRILASRADAPAGAVAPRCASQPASRDHPEGRTSP
jgi:hypothetical protein